MTQDHPLPSTLPHQPVVPPTFHLLLAVLAAQLIAIFMAFYSPAEAESEHKTRVTSACVCGNRVSLVVVAMATRFSGGLLPQLGSCFVPAQKASTQSSTLVYSMYHYGSSFQCTMGKENNIQRWNVRLRNVQKREVMYECMNIWGYVGRLSYNHNYSRLLPKIKFIAYI